MTDCKFQKELEEIIVQGNAKILVETARKIAEEMIQKAKWGGVMEGGSVSTSQIRNIFGASKRIEMALNEKNVADKYGELILLKPKMAYANGRFNKDFGNGRYKIPGFKTLVDCLSHAIDKIDGDYKRMKNFFNFFEAILAYHKAEGGK
jgi:CRISPR-associated protein Csm2